MEKFLIRRNRSFRGLSNIRNRLKSTEGILHLGGDRSEGFSLTTANHSLVITITPANGPTVDTRKRFSTQAHLPQPNPLDTPQTHRNAAQICRRIANSPPPMFETRKCLFLEVPHSAMTLSAPTISRCIDGGTEIRVSIKYSAIGAVVTANCEGRLSAR
ncbi:hypothetical protein R3P38DRAFT_2761107 [Favolaschia claudopus]|uniref:Uncharacterized protein n=1 Tax=Favolaschia claudopus TaxID=2862362 RepID=A0AAW0DWC5_9AGAR